MSAPSEPARLKAFAHFFKNYMSLAAVVTAALPIPVASLKLIPTFEAQTKFLSVYASLFCFLVLAFLFQCRHSFARWMFLRPRRVVALLPLGLIVIAAALVFAYHATIESAVRLVQETHLLRGMPAPSTTEVFRDTDYLEIPHALRLAATYLGFFFAAEAAFILMALREYLQDLLGLEELELINR